MALAGMNDARIVPALERAAHDPDPGVRTITAWALGEIGAPRAADVLHRLALYDGDVYTRLKAIEALAGMADACDVVTTLVEAIQDESAEVRQRASTVLAELGDASALEPLRNLVRYGERPEIRGAAVAALRGLHETRAVKTLHEALNDRDRGVRLQAVKALGTVGGAAAVDALQCALTDREVEVRLAAVSALRDLKQNRM